MHPEEIELGLDRVAAVFNRLGISFNNIVVITVAGTNGKGSTVAMLESIYRAAGYRTGCYTSPHLLHFNERVRINGVEVGDDVLCDGFAAIDSARGDTELTYFEFGTLAALKVFANSELDLLILETGLGGRLDAVNIIDSDVAVITSIDLDHRDWLGDTREQIGEQKAGIFRRDRAAVCGDPAPPGSIARHAQRSGTQLYQMGRDFTCTAGGTEWTWRDWEGNTVTLPLPNLPGEHQVENAATTLATIRLLADRQPVTQAAIRQGLRSVSVPGRLQSVAEKPLVLLDVAHNPAAIGALAQYLERNPVQGKCRAVLGMLRDKDIPGGLQAMLPVIDAWYLCELPGARAASMEALTDALVQIGNQAPVRSFPGAVEAYQAARKDAAQSDRVIVFGSFLTVSAIMAQL